MKYLLPSHCAPPVLLLRTFQTFCDVTAVSWGYKNVCATCKCVLVPKWFRALRTARMLAHCDHFVMSFVNWGLAAMKVISFVHWCRLAWVRSFQCVMSAQCPPVANMCQMHKYKIQHEIVRAHNISTAFSCAWIDSFGVAPGNAPVCMPPHVHLLTLTLK